MNKICPLLMMANDSDWDTVNNAGCAQVIIENQQTALDCIESRCAWWDELTASCAVLRLAQHGRKPVDK